MKKNHKKAKHRDKHSLKCPVQIGNEYKVDITAKTPKGPGIARVQDFIVLVNGAQIGENKTIVITKIEPFNAEAEIVV